VLSSTPSNFSFPHFTLTANQNVLKLYYFLIYENVITKINPVFQVTDFILSQNIQFLTVKLVNNQAKGHLFQRVSQPSEHTISNKSIKTPYQTTVSNIYIHTEKFCKH